MIRVRRKAPRWRVSCFRSFRPQFPAWSLLGFRFLNFHFNAGQELGLSVPMSIWVATNANITFEVWNETAFT